MITALVLFALAGAPDAGTPLDAPWLEVRDGGVVVVMSEATAVAVAAKARACEVEQAKDEAALVASDPSPVKIAIGVVAGVLAGAALAISVTCGTGHCR